MSHTNLKHELNMEFYFFLVCEGLMLRIYTVIGRVKDRQERKKSSFQKAGV